MARKKKLQIEKHPGVPRGAEHVGTQAARLTETGAEIPSDEPITLRVGNRRVTDFDTLRSQIAAIRASDGPVQFETFAEADDFDVEDDYGAFTSRWEIPADQDGQVTVEEYIRFRTTGEIPAHILQDLPPHLAAKAPSGSPQSSGGNPGSYQGTPPGKPGGQGGSDSSTT